MPDRKLRVFLCHSSQDKPIVRELYQRLKTEGWIDPWLDEEKLLPGMDWDMEIEKAVEAADVVVVCLSNNSVSKEGYVQRELRFVLDIALEMPEGTIFLVPLRLDNCQPPRRLRALQYVDYFPQERRDMAYRRLCESLGLRANKLKIESAKSIATPNSNFRENLGIHRKPLEIENVEFPDPDNLASVLIIYSRTDGPFKDELAMMLTGLQRRGVIESWQERQIEQGSEWFGTIKKLMEECEMAVLLVSPDFIASRFIQEEELNRLLQRHIEKGLHVVPIIVRPCLWQDEPVMRHLQALPKDGRPVLSFSKENGDRDQIWMDVGKDIERIWKSPRIAPVKLPNPVKVFTKPSKVFISYSHKDEPFKDEFITMLAGLQRLGVIESWQEQKIESGSEWFDTIKKSMKECEMAVLLVSPNFIASRFMQEEELKRLLQRRIAEGMRVVPIIVRPCLWQDEPVIKDLQALPKEGKPVISFIRENGDRDQVWTDIGKDIEGIYNSPRIAYVKLPNPAKVFISYSHKDEPFKDELVQMLTGLQRRGVIDIWQEREIEPGSEWFDTIRKSMKECEMAVMLISPDFIASRFMQEEELKRLLQRRIDEGLYVVPIIVRPCLWQSEPVIKDLQALPKDGKPVLSFSKENGGRDQVWTDICKAIDSIARSL